MATVAQGTALIPEEQQPHGHPVELERLLRTYERIIAQIVEENRTLARWNGIYHEMLERRKVES